MYTTCYWSEVVQMDLYKLQNIDDLEVCNAYSDIIIEKLDIIATR